MSFYEINKNVYQSTIKILLFLLIIFFVFSFVELRGNTHNEFVYCTWILTIVWLSDIGGYVCGKLIGGPRLTKYSPNKTIAGFLGSLLFSQFSFLLLFFFYKNFNLSIDVFLIQLFLCLIAIIGDILFSFVKRLNNIKDYSNLLPGHGGILDRLDGVIFVVSVHYLLKITNVI